MHEIFFQYIQSQLSGRLTSEEMEVVTSVFKSKKLKKNQYFLTEGEICRHAGFVVKGALKMYVVDDSGKEDILGLFVENWWVGDRESFIKSSATPFFIEAVEETNLLIINKSDYEDKLKSMSFMQELAKTLSEKQSLQLLKRVYASKSLSAEQRLSDLENNYPEFLQRFPQHTIASYLGMTKETMSRIRSNSHKK